MSKFELLDWVNNEKLDIKTNSQILEELYYLLHSHMYEEGVFARQIRNKAEKQQIKREMGKLIGLSGKEHE